VVLDYVAVPGSNNGIWIYHNVPETVPGVGDFEMRIEYDLGFINGFVVGIVYASFIGLVLWLLMGV